MPIAIRARQSLTRRQLLVRSASTAALAGFGSLAAPYLSRAADRPRIAGGLASGDVSAEFRGGVGERGPAGANAGGLLDGRKLCDHHSRRYRRTRCQIVTSRRKSCSKGFRPGRIFSTGFGSRNRRRNAGRNAGRAFPDRAGGQALGILCLVGRYRGAGLGHRSSARRHADLPDHARQPAGFLHSLRRSHLRRLSDPFGIETAGRRPSGGTS